ncbi:MAG: HNH endonuclease [Parcubacteria group bacterium]|nr:HNH endonuclease [Parcubacteria group bacterium]
MTKPGSKIKRKASTVNNFLEKKGLKKVPKGKEIDHKKPLVDGGTDTQSNLHLIKKSTHKKKTASEARRRAKK